LGEENLDRWAHAETTVPDWWGQKDIIRVYIKLSLF
jgi:hypothetical protein